MKFFLLILMLAFCGCFRTEKPSVFSDEHQVAVASEIVSIQYAYTKALINLNNTNAADFMAEANSLADRLEAIAKELDTMDLFPMDLRKATLEKLNDTEIVGLAKKQTGMKLDMQPEAIKKIIPVMERYLSAVVSVENKAGLKTDAKGNPIDDQTVLKFRFNNSTN